MSKLYVVGTPIGNLSDMSKRAVDVLNTVDFIAAEDTRVTLKILNHFGIKKPMISYFEHNIRSRGEEIITKILGGEDCAVVTDAGMPCISDPGEDLVKLCYLNGIEVVVIPGPSAVVSALCISGQSTKRFCFEGFLSTVKKQRREHLLSLKNEHRTMIFYEAPHKLKATLKDMLDCFGDRNISLCRELTKIHEQVIRTTLKEAVAMYEEANPKGEFVLVIEGAPQAEDNAEEVTLKTAVEMARNLISDGKRPTDACKEVANLTGYKKSEIYNML